MSGHDGDSIFGVKVRGEDGLKVGAFLSVVVGGPLYALILEGGAWIDFIGGAIAAIPRGIFSWLTRWVSTLIGAPEAGFAAAQRTFAYAIRDFGLLGFAVSILVASTVVGLFLWGVTRAI